MSTRVSQDPSSVYFVHPLDSSTSQLVLVKFNGEGFSNWKRSMLLTLSAKNKIGFVNGTIEPPEITSTDYKLWERCNDLVISWILFNLDDSIARSVLFLKTARSIWLDLESRFGYTSVTQVFSLEQKLSEMKQGQLSVSEFYTQIKTVWDLMDDADPLPNCTCDKCTCLLSRRMKQMQQNHRVLQFLMKLNDQFSMIRANILMMVPLPDLTQVYRMVAQEETHKEFYQNQNETLAFVADKRRFNDTLSQNLKSTGNSQRQGFNNSTKRFNQKPTNSYYCTHCKLAGHSNDRCFKLHGYPTGFKVRERRFADAVTQNEDNSSNTSSAPVFMQQYNELLELLNKHKMSSCDQHFKEPDIAGHAMLADFISFNPVNDIESHITIPDGRKIKALSQNQPPLLLGELQNGLYTVASTTCLNQHSTLCHKKTACITVSDEAKLWHLRLGHLPFHQLKLVQPTCSVHDAIEDSFCQICPKAKQPRCSFPISSIHTVSTFQLLHVNIWGPYRVKNHNGCNQFVTIVDDFTRYTWIHLIKFKSDVVSVLEQFVKFVEVQFNSKVHCISIDHTSGIDQANSDINVHSPFTNTPSTSVHTSPDNSSASTQISSSSQSDILPVVPVRQSTRVKRAPSYLSSYHCHLSNLQSAPHWCNLVTYDALPSVHKAFLSQTSVIQEPKSYQEACQHPLWIDAINKELKALADNNTWDLVELPPGKKSIGNKWVFKVKLKADGFLERGKARLVAKGFNQKHGIDYDETFSLVVKMTTVRCLIVLAASRNWKLYQLDVNNAFLHGDLKEEIFMKVPEGVPHKVNQVCRLKKSLYGLKQASREWFFKLLQELLFQGYTQSKNDYSLFMKNCNGLTTIVAVYVDDIILTGDNQVEIECLKSHLDKVFSIKDLDDPELYRSLVGKLNYLTNTRQNLSYVVQTLSQFLHNPRLPHLHALNHTLRYVAHTIGQGILLKASNTLKVQAFSDSDWASLILFGNSPVSWKSKKQSTVSRSSFEAEYRAMAATASEITWLVRLLEEFGVTDLAHVTLHCDNQSALHIAKNPVFHERTKHIELDCHFTHDKVLEGLLQLSYLPTKHQLADVLTKVVPSPHFKELLCKLGLSALPSQSASNLRGAISSIDTG
ncbi:hypothetical protein AgCh_035258 [Apium graveolens]